MAFTLYYEAKRKQPLTEKEKQVSAEIAERYSVQYPFKQKVEDFVIYDIETKDDVIFIGSTKLIGTDPENLFKIANYWLQCLTEITHFLENATWTVTFEEVELIFETSSGWRFPNDEEYGKYI